MTYKPVELTIYAGRSGEAEQWLLDLLRMYLGFFSRENWVVTVIDSDKLPREITLRVVGDEERMRNEAGVHSRTFFNTDKKVRQTTFALVSVNRDDGKNRRVRTYTDHPYNEVKNYITNRATDLIQKVLVGHIDLA